LRRPTKTKHATVIDMHIGRQLRSRRILVGLSQEELAEELGITFQQIQKYEGGKNRIAAGRLFELAKVLRCSILYFFQGVIDELSGAPLGFAEEAAPPLSPPSAAEAAQLSSAFNRIPDLQLRRRILEFVTGIAKDACSGS
jgi:transcriptional regulator with XRE-family HTH domain